MSTINAQNYGDGTSSVPASAVLEGTAKAWLQVDQVSGAADIDDSYNVSSVTDTAAGRFDYSFSNNMSASTWGLAMTSGEKSAATVDSQTACGNTTTKATSGHGLLSADSNNNGDDMSVNSLCVFGDLA